MKKKSIKELFFILIFPAPFPSGSGAWGDTNSFPYRKCSFFGENLIIFGVVRKFFEQAGALSFLSPVINFSFRKSSQELSINYERKASKAGRMSFLLDQKLVFLGEIFHFLRCVFSIFRPGWESRVLAGGRGAQLTREAYQRFVFLDIIIINDPSFEAPPCPIR